MSIDKERVRLLVAALRSGDYTQARGTLRRDEREYCCLGVACDVASLNGLGIGWRNVIGEGCGCGDCPDRWRFDGAGDNMPPSVYNWFGFDDPDDVALVGTPYDPDIAIDADSNNVTMVRANDVLEWNFNQIADALETRYLNEGDGQ